MKNANRRYECKEYPYSGWCNGAAWAYAPGSGAYWADAWYDRGACAGRTGSESETVTSQTVLVSPNPSSDLLTIHLDITSQVSIYNTQGIEVKSINSLNAQGIIDIRELPSGMYLIKIDTGSEVLTRSVIKN